jgi:predicted CoA-binding protein
MADRQFNHKWPDRVEDHRVVVLGASPKPARYANRAVRELVAGGYSVIPVHPKVREIEGLPVVHKLGAIHERVHTLTLYVGPERSLVLADDIVSLNPGRVILNPGTESGELEKRLRDHHIECLHACTLVMLRTGQF